MGDSAVRSYRRLSEWADRRVPVLRRITHRWTALFAVVGCVANAVAWMCGSPASAGAGPVPFAVLAQCAVLCMAVSPSVGGFLTALVWCVHVLVPSGFVLPPSYVCCVCLAVGALEYVMTPAGFAVAVVVGLVTAAGDASAGAFASWTGWEPLGLASLTIPLFVCIAACGRLLAYRGRIDGLEAELSRRRADERTAYRLHDAIANELSDATLLLRESLAATGASDHEILCRQALGHMETAGVRMREVILALEHAGAVRDPAGGGAVRREELRGRLHGIADRQRRTLSACGFDGVILMPSDLSRAWYPAVTADLLCGLVGECGANIRRHASRRHRYVMTVEAHEHGFVLELRDYVREGDGRNGGGRDTAGQNAADSVEADRDAGAAGMVGLPHTGLRRYRRMLERIGGRCEIRCDGPQWSLKATIPCVTPEP